MRPFEAVDLDDATRTMETAMALETADSKTAFQAIDQVWKNKGDSLAKEFDRVEETA